MRRAPITLGVRRPQPQPDMNQQITREILWNVPVAFRILLYAMLVACGWCCATRPGKTTLFARPGAGFITRSASAFLGLFIGTTIIFFNDGIAEAAGFFGFPYYLMGMTEVL